MKNTSAITLQGTAILVGSEDMEDGPQEMVEEAEKTGVTLFMPFRLKSIDVTKAIGVLIVRNRPERGMAPFRAASPSS